MIIFSIRLLAVTILLAAVFNAVGADESQSLSMGPFELTSSGDGMLIVGAGEFNAFRQRDAGGNGASALVNLEYRFGRKIFYLGFAAGGLVNSDGGSFLYVGNYADIRYKNYIATPLLSVGRYNKGAGPDLGGVLQFRSSVTLAYELQDGSRVGVRVAHISNARIRENNPGANEVLLTYGLRF